MWSCVNAWQCSQGPEGLWVTAESLFGGLLCRKWQGRLMGTFSGLSFFPELVWPRQWCDDLVWSGNFQKLQNPFQMIQFVPSPLIIVHFQELSYFMHTIGDTAGMSQHRDEQPFALAFAHNGKLEWPVRIIHMSLGGNQCTHRKSRQTQGEHANPNRKPASFQPRILLLQGVGACCLL